MANFSGINFDIAESQIEKAAEFIPPDIFVSGHTRLIMENIVDVGFSSVVCYVGIVSNLLVLIVFYRQGFGDSISVSMSAIAAWDLVKCLSGAVQRLYAPLGLVSRSDSVSWANISTATLTYLITFSSYVSSALAAYVAVERCLCVIMPFKVRFLLTPRTTLKFMLVLSFVVFGSFVPIFFIYDIVWIYSPKYNTSIAIYSYSQFFELHNRPLMKYYNLMGIIYPTASFFIIVISTAIIISRLKDSTQFRSENVASKAESSDSAISSRDKQVMKMLLVIIVVYVIALFPRIILYLAKYYVSEFYFLKKYHNIFLVVCYIILILDFSNATVNFYIFLAMSTNFRLTFLAMFNFNPHSSKNNVK